MARNNSIKILRATRAALDAQAVAVNLRQGEPYLITDENRFAIGTSTSAYQAFLKEGEGGGGISTATTVNIDFGTVPVYSKAFQIADATALTGDKFIAVAAPDSDEYEMDGLLCSAYCAVAGTITLFVQAQPGPLSGVRKVTYTKA